MHKQNWQEPLIFDWFGKNGPPFTQEDLYNSEISQMIRNEFHPPWEVQEYVRQKPWWNPRGPRACDRGTARYIPGRQKIPQYPRLSTLTKAQHLSGLKVLSGTYSVPPYNFPSPKQDDYASFDNIKDIYEDEQKEYRLWARQCWVNEDCIRIFQPKPLLETVYDAQFQLKKNEICALPQEFTMIAQISLEPRKESFELKPVKALKSVDLNTLPLIDYPDVLEEDVSIMKHYVLPVPCPQHPTRFILPHEKSVTTLPLPEVNRQLARYANENDATFIASEKALQCLLEYEQVWRLPVYIEEVVLPGDRGVENVVVVGSELCAQKECGAQRTYKAFRHLLRTTFTRSSENSQVNFPTDQPATVKDTDGFHSGEANKSNISDVYLPTDQPATVKDTDGFHSGEANKSNISDEDEMKINVIEQQKRSTESSVSYDGTNNSNAPTNSGDGGGGVSVIVFGNVPKEHTFTKSSENSQVDLPTYQPGTVKDTDRFHSGEANQSNSSDEDELKIDVVEQQQQSTESAVSYDDTNNSNAPSDAGLDGDGRDGVIVFGSVPKKYGTFKLFKHLGNTFTKSSEHSQVNFPTYQPGTVKDTDRFHSGEANQSNSSDEDELKIDVIEQQQQSTESAVSYDDTNNSNAPSDAELVGGCGDDMVPIRKKLKAGRRLLGNTFTKSSENSQLNLPKHQPGTVKDTYRFHFGEANQSNSSDEEELKIDVIEQRRRSTESAVSYDDTNNSNAPSDAGLDGGGGDGGDGGVVVFGSVPKKFGTFKSYKHLGNTFTKSSVNPPIILPTLATVKDTDRFHSGEANESNSSDEDTVKIDVIEQQQQSSESAVSYDDTNNSNASSDAGLDGSSGDGVVPKRKKLKASTRLLGNTFTKSSENSQVNLPKYQPGTVKDTYRFHFGEANQSNSSDEEELKIDVIEQRRRSTESAVSYDDTNNSNAPSDAGLDGGGCDGVVVFGGVPKKCGTFKSYKHLLGNTFTKSSGNTQINLPTHQPDTVRDTDQFRSGELNQSNNSDDDELQIDVIEKRRRSTESTPVTHNSYVPSDTNIPRSRSENNLPILDDHLSFSTDRFHSREANQSYSSNDDQLLIDVYKKRRPSSESGPLSYYDTNSSNTPSDAEMSIVSSESNRLIIDEQFSCSTNNSNTPSDAEMSIVSSESNRLIIDEQFNWSTNNSNTPSDAEMSIVSSESNRLIIEEQFNCSSSDIKFEPEVSVPDNCENYQTEAEKFAKQITFRFATDSDEQPALEKSFQTLTEAEKIVQKITFRFATDSDEQPALEKSFQTQTEAEIDVEVPHVEQKQINFAGIFTKIDEAQTSDRISFDTTTLHDAINNIIDENPSSRENIDDTCREKSFQTQTEAEIDVEVPHVEQKQINFAGIFTKIDEAQTSDRISFDTTTLHDAINNIIDKNPSSRENIDDTCREKSFQTQTEAEIDVEVPHVEQKQINFAGIFTKIDEAQTSDRISFDTTTLHDAINNIIDKNPSSRENIDDTCREKSFQTQTEAEIDVEVPHVEKKQINFAGTFTKIDEAQTSDRISFDTTTLHDAINNIIDENPSSRENIDDTCREKSFQTQTEAEIDVEFPHVEQKQINFAGIFTKIDEGQTSDRISFDTTTLHDAINNIIDENPRSRENIDDINCTCKGTSFEVPPPRSFKKWQVKNAATNRSSDLIVHSSHKVRLGNKEAILEPIVEWQPELGAAKQSEGRLRALALALMMRNKAQVVNVRLDHRNGNMIVVNKLDEETFTRWHGDKKSEIADRITAAIEQLRLLKPGQYILAHDSGHGENAMVYSALAEPAGAGFAGHTMSLRPDKDKLSDAQEAIMAQSLYFELSRALLPYHKDQEILPLAFTTNKNHLKRSDKPLARVRVPPQAMQWMKKNRKTRSRH